MFGSFADVGFAAASHGTVLTLIEAWYAVLAYALADLFDFSAIRMAMGWRAWMCVPLNSSPYKARTSPISGAVAMTLSRSCATTCIPWRQPAW